MTTTDKIYRLRMQIKQLHHCPTCACEPREIVETSFDKNDLLNRVETATCAEAKATQEVLDWEIEEAELVWK